jgi:hypothetical protein
MAVSFERFKNLLLDGLRPLYDKTDASLVNKLMSTVANSLAKTSTQVDNLEDQGYLQSATEEGLLKWGKTFGLEKRENEDWEEYRTRLFLSYDRLYITPTNIKKYLLENYSGWFSFFEYFQDRWWLEGNYYPSTLTENINYSTGNTIEVKYPVYPGTVPETFSVAEIKNSVAAKTSIQRIKQIEKFNNIQIVVELSDPADYHKIDIHVSPWDEINNQYYLNLRLSVNGYLIDQQKILWNNYTQVYDRLNVNLQDVIYPFKLNDIIKVTLELCNSIGNLTSKSLVAELTARAVSTQGLAVVDGFQVINFKNDLTTGNNEIVSGDSIAISSGTTLEHPILSIAQPEKDEYFFRITETYNSETNVTDVFWNATPAALQLPITTTQLGHGDKYTVSVDAYYNTQFIKSISSYEFDAVLSSLPRLVPRPEFTCKFSQMNSVGVELSSFSILINQFPPEFSVNYCLLIRRTVVGFKPQILYVVYQSNSGAEYMFNSDLDEYAIGYDELVFDVVLAKYSVPESGVPVFVLVTNPQIGTVSFDVVENTSNPGHKLFKVKSIPQTSTASETQAIRTQLLTLEKITQNPQFQDVERYSNGNPVVVDGNQVVKVLNDPKNYTENARSSQTTIELTSIPQPGELVVSYTTSFPTLTGAIEDYDWGPIGFLGVNTLIVPRTIQQNFILIEQTIDGIKVNVDTSPGVKIYCFYNDPNGSKYYAWAAIVDSNGFIYLSDKNRSDNIINDEFQQTSIQNLIEVNYDITNLFSIYSTEDFEKTQNFATGATYTGKTIKTQNTPKNIGVNVSYQRYPIKDYRLLRFENIVRSNNDEFKFTFEFEFTVNFKKYNEFAYNQGKYGDLSGSIINELVDKLNESKPAGIKSIVYISGRTELSYTLPLKDLTDMYSFYDADSNPVDELSPGLGIDEIFDGPDSDTATTLENICIKNTPQFLNQENDVIAILFNGELWEIVNSTVVGKVLPEFVLLTPVPGSNNQQVTFVTGGKVVSSTSNIVFSVAGTILNDINPNDQGLL